MIASLIQVSNNIAPYGYLLENGNLFVTLVNSENLFW